MLIEEHRASEETTKILHYTFVIKAQQAVSITMAVPAGVKLISLSRGVSRHVSLVGNRYVDVTYVVVHSGALGSMSDRFLEVRIMPVAMHNVPLLTVRLCISDPNKRKLRPAALFSVQSDHLATLFSSLIVANKRILLRSFFF